MIRGTLALLLLASAALAKPGPADWRAEQPKPGPEPSAPIPLIERAELPNGLAVLVHQRHDLPYVAVEAVVPAGDDAQPPGKEGLAALVAEMLQSGTEQRDVGRIADDAAAIGLDLQSESTVGATRVELGALKANLPAAVELIADLVVHPTFPADELPRVKARRVAQIVERADDPAEAIRDVLAAVAFGEGHPYAAPHLGTADSVGKLTRDDLLGFYRARYRPGGAAVVLVGDVTLAEARALVERSAFGSWAKAEAAPIVAPAPTRPAPRGIVMVDKPGAPQSQVGFALTTVPADHPDRVALDLADACLGGAFSSRLNMNLREAHGYTYGAFAGIRWHRGPSLWLGRGAIRTDVTLPAMGEFRNELRRLSAEPPTDAELALARAQLVHGIVGSFETMRDAANAVEELFILKLPLDFYKRYAEAVAKTSRADVLTAIEKHMHADRATIVIVGDRAKIEPDLAIQHRDAFGRVVR